MQDSLDLLAIFAKPFDAAGVPYMVTGSMACIVYGEPRLTHDVDVVVELSVGDDLQRLEQAFPLSDFYLPPEEVLAVEVSRSHRGHFNILHHDTGFKADIYVRGRDLLHDWAFPRRRHLQMEAITVTVAPPEYVILRKLDYFREGRSEKHLRDIAGMLRLSADDIDIKAIEDLAARVGLTDAWATAQAFTRGGPIAS